MLGTTHLLHTRLEAVLESVNKVRGAIAAVIYKSDSGMDIPAALKPIITYNFRPLDSQLAFLVAYIGELEELLQEQRFMEDHVRQGL
jgi:hypothetical protein